MLKDQCKSFDVAPGAHHFAVLLLSSLSLQTLAFHARQRSHQALATAQIRDAERSVVMAFQQHAVVPMLASWPCPRRSGGSERCLGVNPALLQSGRVDDRDWQLLIGNPRQASWDAAAAWSDGLRAGWIWSCFHDAHGSFGFAADPRPQPVSLQGWSRTSQAAATSARTDRQVRRGATAPSKSSSLVQCSCRCCGLPLGAQAVAVLEGLPENADLATSWRFDATGDGLGSSLS